MLGSVGARTCKERDTGQLLWFMIVSQKHRKRCQQHRGHEDGMPLGFDWRKPFYITHKACKNRTGVRQAAMPRAILKPGSVWTKRKATAMSSLIHFRCGRRTPAFPELRSDPNDESVALNLEHERDMVPPLCEIGTVSGANGDSNTGITVRDLYNVGGMSSATHGCRCGDDGLLWQAQQR